MFTGIIETLGEIIHIEEQDENKVFTIHSSFSSLLKTGQSVAHNGVCLTVTDIEHDTYKVTAVKETLVKTALGNLRLHNKINLERAMEAGSRFDGHIVQGHVDGIAQCRLIENENGSTKFCFKFNQGLHGLTVEKGSITVDGVSLTIVDSFQDGFSVVIIPHTFHHTCFPQYQIGTQVNIEFDIIGKYLEKIHKKSVSNL